MLWCPTCPTSDYSLKPNATMLFNVPSDISVFPQPSSFRSHWMLLWEKPHYLFGESLVRRGFRSPRIPTRAFFPKCETAHLWTTSKQHKKNTTTKNTCVNQKMSLNLKTSTLFIIFTTFPLSSQASALQTFCCC